jgi:hypothetical protein
MNNEPVRVEPFDKLRTGEIETPEFRSTWHFDLAPSALRSVRTAIR